jgi:hypothetical protein
VRRRPIAVLLVVLVSWLRAGTARAAEQPEHCAPGWENSVFLTAKSSVVRITDGGGWGAGFFWKTPHRIVTAMHVVARARSFEIVFADGTKARARLVGGDERNDVAILELDGVAPSGIVPLELADPASLSVGEPIIALGHPQAGSATNDPREEGLFTWSISRGILSTWNDHQIQVDIRVTHGNSGGPILDCEGRVIGVVSHGIGSRGDTVNFATGPRPILALDRNPVVPGISLAPTDGIFRIGFAYRRERFDSYGPAVEGGVTFIGKLDLSLRASGLFSVASGASGNRMITGRSGIHGWAGAGWQLRVLGTRVVPNAGLSLLLMQEHATRLEAGAFVDDSATRRSARFAPGVSVLKSFLWADYKFEIDFGTLADSAHFFVLGLPLR